MTNRSRHFIFIHIFLFFNLIFYKSHMNERLCAINLFSGFGFCHNLIIPSSDIFYGSFNLMNKPHIDADMYSGTNVNIAWTEIIHKMLFEIRKVWLSTAFIVSSCDCWMLFRVRFISPANEQNPTKKKKNRARRCGNENWRWRRCGVNSEHNQWFIWILDISFCAWLSK